MFNSDFKMGEVYDVTVKEILPSGVKVEIVPGQFGFIRKKDFVFSKLVEDLHEVVSINDRVKAVIDDYDSGSGFIYLNHNSTQKDPWDNIDKIYRKNQIVEGIVTEIRDNKFMVEISAGIEGYIPDHEIFDNKVMLQKIRLWEKDYVRAKIVSFYPERKKIKLSIRNVFIANNKKMAAQEGGIKITLGDAVGDVLDSVVEKSKKQKQTVWSPGKYPIHTILLVDDEKGILENFPGMLKAINPDFKVFTEKSVLAAIKLYRRKDIDLIITDLYFPENLDGYDLIERIRSINDEQSICVLSGNKNIDSSRLEKYNLAGIMEKPVDRAEVNDTIENIKNGNFLYNLKNKLSKEAYESFYSTRRKGNTYETQLDRLLTNIRGASSADFVGILKMDPISRNIILVKKTGDIKTKGDFEWNCLSRSPVTDVMHGNEFVFRSHIESRVEKFKNFIKYVEAGSFIGIPMSSLSGDEFGLFLIRDKGRHFNREDYENAKNKALQVEKLIDYMNFDDVLNKESKLISTGQLSAALIHELKNSMQVLIGQVDKMKKMVGLILDKKLDLSVPHQKNELAKLSNELYNKKNELYKIIKSFRDLFDDSICSFAAINKIIDAVVEITRPNLKDKKVKFQIEKAEGIPLIRTYEERLKHILINIILNAADQLACFRSSYKAINIETILDENDKEYPFKIRITDNACGIHTALRRRIFDFLYTTKRDGMGLGLFICKSLITSMGGDILIEKSLMYSGTSFLIKLPDTRKKDE